jgi:hypothetical protein
MACLLYQVFVPNINLFLDRGIPGITRPCATLDGFAIAKILPHTTAYVVVNVECTALAQPRLHRNELGTHVPALVVSCRSSNEDEELPCRTRTKVSKFP